MHEVYIIPGQVDGQVVREQAERRAVDRRHPEATIVHDHRKGDECSTRCRLYEAVKQ